MSLSLYESIGNETLFGLNVVHVFHTLATETLMTLPRPLLKHRAGRLGGRMSRSKQHVCPPYRNFCTPNSNL